MKKYFVAYRSTGESPEVLKERMNAVLNALKAAGVDAYCNFFDESIVGLSSRQKMEKAFARIDNSDSLFVLIASSDKSEGQLMEVGYAFAKGKTIIAAIQENAKTYVGEMADKTVTWRSIDGLKAQLKEAVS